MKTLNFGSSYPTDRAKLFALHVIKLLAVPMVARSLGSQGCNLIRVIATLEDNQFYASAVLATDDDLRPMMGVTEKTLVVARRRCIDQGWLHYEPGEKGTPSRMWVTVPHHIDLRLRPNIQWKFSTETSTATGTETSTATGTETSTTTDPSYIPIPISKLPSPAAIPGDWRHVELEMLKFGIGETSLPLNRLQANAVPTDLALGILRYASQVQLWTPGRVRRRLIQLLPGQTPEDMSKWMKPDRRPDPTEEEKAQAEMWRQSRLDDEKKEKAKREEALKKKEEDRERQRLETIEKDRKKQLLIDWEMLYGPQLDAMPDDRVKEIAIEKLPTLSDFFERFGVRHAVVRPSLLEAMADFFKTTKG